MPFFKLCDVSRTTRKAVVANSLEEIIAIGKTFKMMLLTLVYVGYPSVIANCPSKC